MTYTPPAGDAVRLALRGEYTPPDGAYVPLHIAPPCYLRPRGDLVTLALAGEYTPPAGDAVALALVCDVFELPDVDPEPEPEPPGAFFAGLISSAAVAYGLGTPHDAARGSGWRDTPPKDAMPHVLWQQGAQRDRRVRLGWEQTPGINQHAGAGWNWSDPRDAARRITWTDVPAKDAAKAAAWDWGDARDAARQSAWGNPPPKDTAPRLAHNQGQHLARDWFTPWGNPPAKDIARTLPWNWADPLRQEYKLFVPPVPVIPGPPPCYTPPPGDGVPLPLRDAYTPPAGAAVALALVCTPFGPYGRDYRIRRTRIMSHTLTVCRLPGREPIEATSVAISTSIDSWSWSCELGLKRRADAHLVMPTDTGPQEIEVAIDGHVWTFVIEQVRERRGMPATTFSASGRSRTAALAAPYAIARPYINPSATTAVQAAARELEFTDFTLDWRLPLEGWPLPAGVWAYDNLTPMAAIIRIAEAAGAVVQSHPDDLTVIVQPAYTDAPWQWGSVTQDVTIDGQSVLEMGVSWQPGPQYLGVYVSGETQGVLVNVVRDGSAGNPYAQMIVDPLITSDVPARTRGLRIIADSHNQRPVEVEIPLLAGGNPGVVLPGELVQVEDAAHGIYKARSESVSISAALQNDAVTVRQSLRLARHLPPSLE